MSIEPHVLFVTNRDDLATDYLICKVQERGIPYIRINSEDLVDYGFEYRPGLTLIVRREQEPVELNRVSGVLFRRAPTLFPKTEKLEDLPYVNQERRHFLEGIYNGVRAKWVNPLFATYASERKLYQLETASRIGLRIPKTVVSNDPRVTRGFISALPACVIKPISSGLQITKHGAFSIYTSEVVNQGDFLGSELFECPVLLQEKVDNQLDIRLTVVGAKVFPVSIAKLGSNDVDWRKPEIEKRYDHHSVPSSLRKAALQLHERLGLVYSAMDFVLTSKGEYVFLEANPAGEWLWLERELGLEISDALLRELTADAL